MGRAVCCRHLRLDEEVLWFDVSMDHIVPVTILYGFQQLVDVVAYVFQIDSIGVLFEYFEQVLLQIFKYEVESVHPTFQINMEVTLTITKHHCNLLFEAIDKGDNVLLLEIPQHLDLSQGCLLNDLIIV